MFLVSLDRPRMSQFLFIMSVKLFLHGLNVCTMYMLSELFFSSEGGLFAIKRSLQSRVVHFSIFLSRGFSGYPLFMKFCFMFSECFLKSVSCVQILLSLRNCP